MDFREYDVEAASEYFEMLKDGPTIREIITDYPGVENLVHVMCAQLATNFILPYLENQLSTEDLAEALRRCLITCIAFGIMLNRTDRATRYVMDLYNRPGSGQDLDNTG